MSTQFQFTKEKTSQSFPSRTLTPFKFSAFATAASPQTARATGPREHEAVVFNPATGKPQAPSEPQSTNSQITSSHLLPPSSQNHLGCITHSMMVRPAYIFNTDAYAPERYPHLPSYRNHPRSEARNHHFASCTQRQPTRPCHWHRESPQSGKRTEATPSSTSKSQATSLLQVGGLMSSHTATRHLRVPNTSGKVSGRRVFAKKQSQSGEFARIPDLGIRTKWALIQARTQSQLNTITNRSPCKRADSLSNSSPAHPSLLIRPSDSQLLGSICS